MKTTSTLKIGIIAIFVTLASTMGVWGQTTIAQQDFDGTNTLSYTASGGSTYTGTSTVSDSPASANYFVSGATSYGVQPATAVTTTATLTFGNQTGLDLNSDPIKYYTFRLAAWSVGATSNGVDTEDNVKVSISLDGGSTWSEEADISGGNFNARWGYTDGTATAVVSYDGNNSPNVFKTSTNNGIRTADGYSTVKILLPSGCTQAQLKISMTANATTERWTIDDVALKSDLTSAAALNQTINFGTPLSTKLLSDAPFSLTATATSGLPVSYSSSNTAVATISGSTVTIIGLGTTTITTSQSGDANYNAATNNTQTLVVNSTNNASIINWDLSSVSSAVSAPTRNASYTDANLVTAVLSRGAGIIEQTLNYGFTSKNYRTSVGTNLLANAITDGEYHEFSIEPNSGYEVSLSQLNRSLYRSTATAVTTSCWQYSLDNGATFTQIGPDLTYTGLEANGLEQTPLNLNSVSALQNVATKIIIRQYAWGSTGAGNFGFGKSSTPGTLSLNILGTVTPTVVTKNHTALLASEIKVLNSKIIVEGSATFEIFNIAGVKVADAANGREITLSNGIYIVKTEKGTSKIAIK